MPATTEPGRSSIGRRILLALIAISAVWALLVAVTGGLDLRPYQIDFKSTEADRPTYVVLILIALYAGIFRRHLPRDGSWLEARAALAAGFFEHRAATVAFAAAILTVILGAQYGVHVAGGSDSYGYVSQSQLWLSRDLTIEQPIAAQVPWPDADWTFAPLGYRPAQRPGAIIPVYAPGLPLLMALATILVGACGPYIIVPLLAGALVWLTYHLGARTWSRLVGLLAALLVATSPTFQFMTMNPMSDVPVSTFFVAASVIALGPWRTRAFWTGLVLSVAICIRPNLVPIGAVFLGVLLARARSGDRSRTFLWFAAGGLPAVAAIAATNATLYGAPWRAGYGSLSELYSWDSFRTNAMRYTGWLLTTETPFVLLCAVPLVRFWRADRERRMATMFLALLMAAIWMSYLVFAVFDVWWYLRFMLPSFPGMFVLAAIGGALLIARAVGAHRVAALGVILTVPFLAYRVNEIRNLAILDASVGGVVYLSAADYVRTRLPENSVILTIQHSGSIRHYANRLTLRWDLLDPAWWPRAIDTLVERGYRPYFLISSFEEAQLRRRFGLSDVVDAPGSVVAEMTSPEQIRIYDPLRQTPEPPAVITTLPCCPCSPLGPDGCAPVGD